MTASSCDLHGLQGLDGVCVYMFVYKMCVFECVRRVDLCGASVYEL